MKTIIDAVNEFKGEFNNGLFANTHNDNHQVNDNYIHMIVTNHYSDLEVGSLVIYSSLEDRDDVDFICTRDQFNDLVSQMETNFGECEQSYGSYKFDYHLPPEPKPLFSQEMCDNKVLPSAGMECLALVDLNWRKVEVLAKKINSSGCGVAACRVISGAGGQSGLLYWCMDFKPIDTRTDKEKAIDDLSGKDNCYMSNSDAKDLLDDILDGKVFGVKWVGAQ